MCCQKVFFMYCQKFYYLLSIGGMVDTYWCERSQIAWDIADMTSLDTI